MFPRDRFQRAGATPDEIQVFADEYDHLPLDAQQSRDQEMAGISDYDIADLLTHYRGQEEPVESEPEPEPPTILGVVEPPAPSRQVEAEDVTEPEAEPEPSEDKPEV